MKGLDPKVIFSTAQEHTNPGLFLLERSLGLDEEY